MDIEKMKNYCFPDYQLDDWKLKAEESLRGKLVETLQTDTYENIFLKPLYSVDDEESFTSYPGGADYRRGIYPLGYITNKWKVAQHVKYKTVNELIENLKHAVERGQTALSFELSNDLFPMNEGLTDLLKELYKQFPFAMNAKEYFQQMLENLANLKEIDGSKVSGYIGYDPLSSFVINGSLPQNVEMFFKDWSEMILSYNEKFPHLRTVLIRTSTYHNGGANAVQEIGIAASLGVFYIEELQENGMELNEALSKLLFQFSIGSNFFMEIAKIRAARMVWNRIAEVYGANSNQKGMHISAETSLFTKTLYDKHVNILRAGNEAFAAVIGGIQYLNVGTFENNSNLSERLARNTQLILQEEAHLQHIVDPAGGSWYIEKLTTELAEKAWGFFQEIEAKGGIMEVVKSNWLQRKISEVYEKRKQAIFTRNERIIGTNVYAKLDEAVSDDKDTEINYTAINEIEKIPQMRLSKPYEGLRKKAEKLKGKAVVGLISLGSLKDYKARSDFMKGFLAAGGIKGEESFPISLTDSARDFVASCNTKHFCLCGSNERYETLGFEILTCLLAEFPDKTFYLAGLPAKDLQSKWKEKGIKEFIHIKSNCYEILQTILFEMGVSLDEA
ncbi:MAG: methylmalonyl-CoA mutase family protein [Bacillota bacterium]|nr:methylmalonyl-CoA mutase family protein [Bacillota bacterium]